MLSLEAAVAAFLDSTRTRLSLRTHGAYAAVLNDLQAAFAGTALAAFEPPPGTDLLSRFLVERWGDLAPATYNRSLSVLRQFFTWNVACGNLSVAPTVSIEPKPTTPGGRAYFRRSERDAILAANSDPRDEIPLRLLLDHGVEKGSLRRLRFRDFDRSSSRVALTRRGGTHLLELEAEFWAVFDHLIAEVNPDDSHFVFPKELARRYNPSAVEIAARRPQDGAPNYLRQQENASWEKVTVDPCRPRGSHGAHTWWYGCLARGGVVRHGVTNGHKMLKARHTVGRNVLLTTGRLKAVREQLGVGAGGWTGEAYSNRDGDQLETTIRRLRRHLRAASRDGPPDAWWVEPIRRFVSYTVEERDLIELSRVSIEMLRTQDEDSAPLHDAVGALTRVVFPRQLIARAEQEFGRDHSLLHGHSLVAVWGAMETLVLDVVAAWLLHREEARTLPAVGEIKLTYATYESLEPHERAEIIAHELDGQRGPRSGINRFERLLRSVGFSALDATDRPVLASNVYEMQQVRHVFVHKRGLADRDFVRACPHLGYSAGDRILIDRDTWSSVIVTALFYAETVLRRMARTLAVDLPSSRHEVRPIRWATKSTSRHRSPPLGD